MDEELKKLLYEQSRHRMSDKLFERFIGLGTEIHLKDKEELIPYGKFDPNVYVQKSGILRACYFDGNSEKTFGFSSPGSIMMSYHSFFMHRPSFFQFVSCGDTVVLKIMKKDLNELVESSHEFAKWMLSVQYMELYYNEFKCSAITGYAKDRYRLLVQKRPEILSLVSVKIIASYLGVTPNYLSWLKKISSVK